MTNFGEVDLHYGIHENQVKICNFSNIKLCPSMGLLIKKIISKSKRNIKKNFNALSSLCPILHQKNNN